MVGSFVFTSPSMFMFELKKQLDFFTDLQLTRNSVHFVNLLIILICSYSKGGCSFPQANLEEDNITELTVQPNASYTSYFLVLRSETNAKFRKFIFVWCFPVFLIAFCCQIIRAHATHRCQNCSQLVSGETLLQVKTLLVIGGT